MKTSGMVFSLLLCLSVVLLPAAASDALVLPPPDPQLQAGLDQVLAQAPFRKLIRQGRLSVALVDLSDGDLRFAGTDFDRMRYAASLPKIAILLAVFDAVQRGEVAYTPQVKDQLVKMIRFSSNRAATDSIRLVGFENIARTLRDPGYQLYDPNRQGGLWVGKDYGGGLGRWKRDPMHHLSHGATARQVARFLVMLEQGTLVSPWASGEMKEILSHPGIRHKFVKGLSQRPGSRIFRKSGSWREWHSDAAIVEHNGRKYVAVALMESSVKNVLSRLIVRLDDLVQVGAEPPVAVAAVTEGGRASTRSRAAIAPRP